MKRLSLLVSFVISFYAAIGLSQTLNSSQEEAKWLLERLSGIRWPANSPIIGQMAQLIQAGDRAGAANIATSQPSFLNITVKLMALKMSTRDESIRLKLNDFTASFMGVTRDNRDARELLSGNFYYDGDPALVPTTVRANLISDIIQSNNHYADLDNGLIDIGQSLRRVEGQVILSSNTTTVANPDPAGVLTSRAFMGAHAMAGTNRRLVEYTFREFMCVNMENWADTNASDSRIGRDIDRFPGGDNLKFLTSCKGCHTGMDGFRGAFANWDYNNKNIVNSTVAGIEDGSASANGTTKVVNKMNKNGNVYPDGYVTVDNSFVNNSNRGNNLSLFGWRGTNVASGMGVKEFGTLISNSRRFSECLSKRVFEAVCNRELDAASQVIVMDELRTKFETNGYNLKKLFESAALHRACRN